MMQSNDSDDSDLKNNDDLICTPNDLYNGNSSDTSKNVNRFVSQKRAKAQMRKQTEEKVMIQKVSDVCEIMSSSQQRIALLMNKVTE